MHARVPRLVRRNPTHLHPHTYTSSSNRIKSNTFSYLVFGPGVAHAPDQRLQAAELGHRLGVHVQSIY